MLGFDQIKLQNPYNESRSGIQESKILTILINTNITGGGIFNNSKKPYLYGFDPNSVPPGYRIYEEAKSTKYLPVTNSGLTTFRVWLEDQDGNPMKFLYPINSMTIRLELREVQQ